MLISHWLKSLRNRLHQPVRARVSKKRRNQRVAPKQVTTSVEFLEERVLLAGAGPQLISIFPNAGITQPEDTGGRLQQNEVLETAPRELVFRFNPGQVIEPSSLRDGIQVFQSGFDGSFANGRIQVDIGSIHIGEQPNEVVVRFEDSLPDDHYQIILKGTGNNPLRNTMDMPFNNGVDLEFLFEVDLGGMIEGVVHEPIVRTQILEVLDPGISPSPLVDGVTFTVQAGGKPITFEFDDNGTSNADNDNIFAIDISGDTTTADFAASITTALNNAAAIHTTAFGLQAAAVGGEPSQIRLSPTADTAFSPKITPDANVALGMSITDHAIEQRKDFINVYFNANDPLNTVSSLDNPSIVQSPAFYQLINTDGTMRLPDSVIYNADAGVATLRFNQSLADGTYNLRIGETFEATNTLATTVNLGTRFGNVTTTINEFLGGDPTSPDLDAQDVDLYRFEITTGGDVTFDLTATNGLNGYLRLFDAADAEVTTLTAPNGIGTQSITLTLAAGVYRVGISSVGNLAYDPDTGLPRTGGLTTGSYRLAITPDVAEVSNDDDNSSFNTPGSEATDLGNLGTAGQVISAQIEPQATVLLPPEAGGNDEPGHRDIPVVGENHLDNVFFAGRGTDPYAPNEISTIAYTFESYYGNDVQGNPLFNAITAEQTQRAREIIELFSLVTGVQFVEAATRAEARAQGLPVFTVVTGDLRAVANVPTGPGGVAGIAGNSNGTDPDGTPVGALAVMDAGENFNANDNLYGQAWFRIAMHEIGHVLGLGHAYDLNAIMGATLSGEAVFPGDHDIVHLRRLYRRDSIDIDMYQFDVTEAGRVTIETIAERLGAPDGASQLNTVLRLYRQEVDGSKTLIAQNDDYYGNDSFIGIDLAPGTYFVGVSSVGNEDYDPNVADSGAEGRTDGRYELRLDLRPGLQPLPDDPSTEPSNQPDFVTAKGRTSIRDVDNSDQFDGDPRKFTAFDGDSDGRAGGQFSYSFQVGDAVDNEEGGDLRSTIFVDKSAANYRNLADPLGSLTNPFTEIDLALNAARNLRMQFDSADPPNPTPVIVRIVGNSGDDGQVNTLLDNRAYEIGINNDPVNPQVLVDGAMLEVPRDVNVVIDHGAVFKLQDANIDAGSSAQGLDRSGGSLQVLGTTFHNVTFTSWHNDSIGGDSDGVHPGAKPGDWGGIVFREDSDYDFEYSDTQTQTDIYATNNPFVYNFRGLPIPATDATFSFLAFGDFNEPGENLTIEFEDSDGNLIVGAPSFVIFDDPADPTIPDATSITETITLSQNQLLLVAADGEIHLRVTASSGIGDTDTVNNINVIESLRVDLSMGTAVPIFLNIVNHATIEYAGGPVVVDSISQDFDAVHLDNSRPTITNNTITLSANAAISGNPNSFNDSFEDPRRYDHHLDRLGPEVHGNDIFNNTINGLRIRTELQNGVPIEKLEVPARFTSTDIVYVITENFQIDGSPGGLIVDPGDDPDITTDDVIVRRTPGRLRIDPGVVVKFSGSRVEMERGGSNLIAEGTPEDPIIFTSINDDKFGRGGSFDTANDGAPFQDFGLVTLDVTFTAEGPSPATDGQVENVTPNNEVTGAAHVIAAHPTNPDLLYIGGTNGGIWRTENATAPSPTWTPLTDQLGSLSLGALEFDPTDSTNQTLVAGIGRFSSFGRRGGDRIGLLRTTDGGDSWTVLSGGGILTGKNISGVAARGDTIVVSVNVADTFSFPNIGIFRSTDGGDTFTQISMGDGSANGLPGGVSYDLASDPNDPNVLYTSVTFSGIVGGQVGIYKSLNAGLSWTKVSDAAIDAFIDDGTTNLTGTSNLEISVGTSNNVYAGIINAGRLAAMFRSGDGGATWVQLDTPSTNEGGTNVGLNPSGGKGPAPGSTPEELAGGQGGIHFSILADPGDPNIVYVGGDRQPRSDGDTGTFPNSIGANDFTGRLFRGDASQPLGSQFVHLTHSNSLGAAGGGTASSSAPHADSREMVFDANGDIIEVDDGGIYRRTSPRDNTGDWLSIIGNLQITEVHDVAYDSVSNILISGNQDTGTTQQTSPGSDIWESVSTADGGDVVVDDTSTPGRSFRYSSFQNLGFFRRREYDATNTFINETIINTTGIVTDPQFVTPLALNAVNAQRLIIGGSDNIYESLNQGDTINQIAPVGANRGPTIAYGGFIGANPNPDVLWVGGGVTGNQVFLRTTPGGPLNPTNYGGDEVRGVFLDPNDWRIAFVIDSDQVFMTEDAGATYIDITGAASFDMDLRSITYIEGTTTDALLVGGRNGVFAMDLRTPGTWFNVGTNLPNAPAYDMEYDAVDDVLVVGTLGRGTFSITNASQLIIQELDANEPEPIGLTPTPGDWAGFVFNAASSGNFDYVEVRYGGGLAPIAGGFAAFNPVEIIQSDVRISNSEFEDNADGRDSETTSFNRIGRGSNVASTIFVRGSQPTIVTNIFENNESLVVSVNANAMQAEVNADPGRATGALFSDPLFGSVDPNVTTEYANNFGPLVRNNRLSGNGINAMEVRGGELTTETAWDDTDIVHVLRSEIIVPNLHTFGGLRLQSSGRESLVVKLQGTNAGFTAGGTQLDIDDRVGGTLEIVGTPGRPVVLTSLFDNSVGAGFAPDGTPLLDTVDPLTNPAPAPGDWRSVRLDEFSNDRNVAVYNERERPTRLDSDVNNIPNVQPNGAEPIGTLAPNLLAADDNRRAGFEIHGFINTDDPTDQDVYSFVAVAGTEVWFDIDRTATSLDTVLELINSDGSIVFARSDDSQDEQINPNLIDNFTDVDGVPLRKDERLGGDYYTTNPKDAGMRVILPGNVGTNNTYFIRVRSNGPSIATANPGQPGAADGITSGEYQLQIRLQQRDEHPGSTVQLSQIRYATNGIEIFGQPGHSPLAGETGEPPELRFAARENDTVATATFLGNLLEADLNTLGVSGNLSETSLLNGVADDYDFYRFEIDYPGIQQIAGVNDGLNPFSLTFDIDYADGLARPNTSLYIIAEAPNGNRQLILRSTDSNVADDRPAPGEANDLDDTSRGTVGALDPYIGSIELTEGTYYAVVTASTNAFQVLNQFTTTNSASNGLRLQPINSIFRVTEDHIEDPSRGVDAFGRPLGGFALNPAVNQGGQTSQDPTTLTQLFDTTYPNYDTRIDYSNTALFRPESSIVPWALNDVSLIISRDDPNDGTNSTELIAVNPFTGVVETTYGTFSDDVRDIDINRRRDNGSLSNGTIIGFDIENVGNINDGNMGALLTVDVENFASPTVITRQEDGILTYVSDGNAPPAPVRPNNGLGVGIQFNAITYNNGTRTQERIETGLLIYGVGVRRDNQVDSANILYEFTSAGVAQSAPSQNRTGTALLQGAATQIRERGILDTNQDAVPGGANAGTALLVPDAANNGNFIIFDGARFSVDEDPPGPPITTFVMDSGPAGDFNVNVLNNTVVRDEDFVVLDPNDGVADDEFHYEFETGPVLEVLTTSGLQLLGDFFSITDDAGTTVTFEFTNNNSPQAGRIGIDLQGANTRNAIANRIVTAITNLGGAFTVVATSLNNGSGRISLQNDVAVDTAGSNPADFGTDGDYGIVGSANPLVTNVAVSIEEHFSSAQIAQAFSNAVNGANPGFSNDLVNFPTFEEFDTISFQMGAVFTDRGLTGDAGDADPLSVNFYVGEAQDQVAASIATAITTQTTANATALGGVVQIVFGIFADPTDMPPFEIGGAAPGGFITGTAVVNGNLYAVTDQGGFFEIIQPTQVGGADVDYIDTSAGLIGLNFQGLTVMPAYVEGGNLRDDLDNSTPQSTGAYHDLLVGITEDGTLYAFDTNGVLQPVFMDGQSSIRITDPFNRDNSASNVLGSVHGISFSNLDENLWHLTQDRGLSLGFTNERDGNAGNNTYGSLTGGSHGTMETATFSLEGYSAADQPTLYFDYFLETEGASGGPTNDPGPEMRDAFRVYIADEDGVFDLITSNNPNELGIGPFETSNPAPFRAQETFDNSGDFRQARIDLSAYAGKPNLQLRFEFSTAASLDIGNILTGGDELRARNGATLRDGDTFTIDAFRRPTDRGNGISSNVTFEFDLDHTIIMPPGSQIADGDQITITDNNSVSRTFTFVLNGTTAGTTIGYTFNDTATALANRLAIRITNQGGFNVIPHFGPNPGQRVQLENAMSITENTNILANGVLTRVFGNGSVSVSDGVNTQTFSGTAEGIYNQILASTLNVRGLLAGDTVTIYDAVTITPITNVTLTQEGPSGIVNGADGDITPTGNIVLNVHADMTDDEVADVIRNGLADFLLLQADGVTYRGIPIENIKAHREVVRVIGHDVVDSGRLGLTNVLPANDAFRPIPGTPFFVDSDYGDFESNRRNQNNNFEGVYVDNILIGFAERGEIVTGAAVNNLTPLRSGVGSEIHEGNYQLEIRRGTDYTIGQLPAVALEPENILDTNDRLTDQITITIPDGEDLFDGQSFQLSDGVNTLVFEFEDLDLQVGDPNFGIDPVNSDFAVGFRADESAHVIAARLRDLFNSTQVRNRLAITSALAEGSLLPGANNTSNNFGGFTNEVNVFGAISAAVNGSVQNLGGNRVSFPEIEPNQSIITAQDLERLPFNLLPNQNINDLNNLDVSEQFPHITIDGSGDQTFDYYSFNIANAGDRAIFDIDGATFDTELFLYDLAGNLLDSNDDFFEDTGSTSVLDAFLQFTFFAPGTYVIGVGRFNSFGDPGGITGLTPDFGDSYTLQIAIENHTFDPSFVAFDDTFNREGFLEFEFFADTELSSRHIGDGNLERVQGSVQIGQNFIFDTANVGILVDDRNGNRLAGEQPVIGTPRQLPTPNDERLTRGVKLSNNVIAHFGSAGIVLDGDENAGTNGPLAAVPFHRVINNTIYGADTPTGDGVRVSNNVAPTLLNNIISNTNVAINNDGSPDNDIVVARSSYANNNTVGVNGVNPQFILAGEPLFVDPSTNNFYLAAGARPIDSARNQFEDRDSIVQVGASIGIPQSNLFAPEFDAFGQFRADDEDTPNSGEGNRPFFDRGAVEREDISGPSARLISPEDNDGQGFDLDPDATEVFLENAVIRSFIVGLDDIGIGIDDSSVNTTNVQLSRDGLVLTAGVDYLFRYNANTKQITLEAASGVFPFGAYQINLLNNNGIRDLAGNDLLANRQPAGTTAFDIVIAPPPEISISDVTVVEGDSGTTFAEFVVSISGPTRLGATVNFQTSDGTATSAAGPLQDYIAQGLQTLVFDDDPNNDPDGNLDGDILTQLVRVEIIGDLRPEGDETFFVTLSDPVNASIALNGGQATGTINDDDLLLRLTPTTQTQLEGDSGTTDMNFTVTLVDKSGSPILTPLGFDVMVDYSTADNTAFAGQDYEATTGTVTILGTSTVPVPVNFAVPIIGDEIQEDPPLEDFMVSLSNPINAGIDSAFQTVTGEIQDDDPKFRVDNSPLVVEGESGTTPVRQVVFTVSISSAVVSPVSVDFATQDTGTAVAGVDYVANSGTLTFNPGGPLTQNVTVTITGDLLAEGDEMFDLVLSNPTAGGIAVPSGTATIVDDDPQISINDVSVVEGDFGTTNATFTVSLSQPAATGGVTVDFTTSLGNNVPAPLPGQIYETTPNSTFNTPQVLDPRGFGRVADPNINDSQGTNVSGTIDHITILGRGNDDFDYFAFNGNAGQRLILDMDGATFNSRVFVYNSNGTVVFSNDDGFPNGGPNGDGTDAGSDSTEDAFLEVLLTNSDRYTIAVGRSDSTPTTTGLTGTPLNNGDQYTLHVSLSDFTVPTGTIFEEDLSTGNESIPNDSLAAPRSLEGEHFNTTFNPNINDHLGNNISTTVPYVIIQGTGESTGTPTADYYSFEVTTPGSFGYFDIDGASFDTVLDVFGPSPGNNLIGQNDDGAVLDNGSSSGLDSLIRVFFPQAGTYTVRVTDLGNAGDTLDAGATYQLNVAIENHALGVAPNVSGPTPIDGTANPGSDFDPNNVTPSSGTVNIPAGQSSAIITVPVIADQVNELDENFFVRLSNATGGVIQDGTGEGTIVNDDAPIIAINDPAPLNESGPLGNPNILTFTVTLSRPADVDTTIDFATADNTAIGGQDYVSQSGQLSFAIGEQTKTINVQLIKDGELNEPNETFFVNLFNPLGADFGDNQAIGTIVDNTGLVERVVAVVAPDAGQPGVVRVLDANGGERFSFEPYPGFLGGVRVAVGDINNDGTPDIVTVPGPGGGPQVSAFSGVDGTPLLNFNAFDPNFRGGLYVAVGDFAEGVFPQGDSFDDIVVSPDAGGGPHLRAFSTATGPINNRTFNPNNIGTDPNRLLYNFFAYDPNFFGGVRVAAGDVTGDGVDDLVVAPGKGGGPHIQVYNGRFTGPNNPPTTTRDGRSFFAYSPNFTGGIYLAVGDVDTRVGAEGAEIITGPGAGGGPHVRVFNVRDLGTTFAVNPNSVAQFLAYAPNMTAGVRVGVGFANDADTNLDVLTVPGPGGGAHLRAFSGASVASPARGNNLNPPPQDIANIFPYGGATGTFVAGVQNVNVQFVGAPLLAAESKTATSTVPLTQQDVNVAREAALDRLREAGVSEADIAGLSQVSITVDDLSGDFLGLATTGGIVLDVNAAGNGWFIDPTPDQDEEFSGTGSGLTAIDLTAARRMDLLTVIMHELGHKLGLDDLRSQLHPDALMSATLPVGTRRLPTSEEFDEAFTDGSLFDSLLLD